MEQTIQILGMTCQAAARGGGKIASMAGVSKVSVSLEQLLRI